MRRKIFNATSVFILLTLVNWLSSPFNQEVLQEPPAKSPDYQVEHRSRWMDGWMCRRIITAVWRLLCEGCYRDSTTDLRIYWNTFISLSTNRRSCNSNCKANKSNSYAYCIFEQSCGVFFTALWWNLKIRLAHMFSYLITFFHKCVSMDFGELVWIIHVKRPQLRTGAYGVQTSQGTVKNTQPVSNLNWAGPYFIHSACSYCGF